MLGKMERKPSIRMRKKKPTRQASRLATMYDDEVDVVDADEVQSNSGNSPKSPKNYPPSRMEMHAEMRPKNERPQSANKLNRSTPNVRLNPTNSPYAREMGNTAESSEGSENSDDDDDEDVQAAVLEGAYDPKEYEHLPVSSDIKELFEYITYYTPQVMDMDYKLQQFVPEYIPAVGDIDAFIKVARPDGIDDQIGLLVLDEPSSVQSEPAVMHLKLRASTKQSSAKTIVVKKLQNADKNPKAIEKWIQDISELHKSKPAPTIQYSRPMPDIDSLMQEWPPDFEQKLNEVGLPLEELEVDLLTYVDIILALFDIPRYESRIESLHVLFSLYSAVKNYKNNNDSLTNDEND
ncbi:intraflagellar transport protein 46 homolog isoform X2 [Cimex lectularius]|uniref:Intraflagellar transport protein 46 homolog n=1 Tax=Cimex lectularius TaxID=79782 RepID=A0A8I6SQ81_CIMLE|nr:intraflagellar transport protein 46 homolog isoform X2 [Cimex lectularius]